jgi:hypothetical protein
MSAFTSPQEAFSRTVSVTKILLDIDPQPVPPFMHMTQFGCHGYSISVSQIHIDYLQALSDTITPNLPIFDSNSIDRWKLINELLVAGFAPRIPGTKKISDQFPALAALAAFPTLEEISRRLAGCWDEDGILSRDIPASDGVTIWKNGASAPKIYKSGQRIVILSNKLQLAHNALNPKLRKIIESLDIALQRPMIDGMESAMSPLYSRLEYFRDHWVHGRKFDGWEALFISLYIAHVYFGSNISSQVVRESVDGAA